MPDFGIMRGFNEKLFGDKLVAGQLPTQLGLIGSQSTFVGLLDTYPNAAAAYSLRNLRTAYTGSAIRVRRSSDNTEQNIGFVNNELDTSSLTTFCGAGNGFVTTWYDQSGNGLNVTQTTALLQPQIVSGGSLITTTGIGASKPTFSFNGTTSVLTRTFLNFSDYTMFNVQMSNGGIAWQNGTGNGVGLNTNSGSNKYSLYERGIADHDFGTRTSALRLISGVRFQSSAILNGYINNTLYTLSPSTCVPPSGTFYIGQLDVAGAAYSGNQSELIFYSTNQTSNITGIQNNINSYYAIY
jgi:hypothetical protein